MSALPGLSLTAHPALDARAFEHMELLSVLSQTVLSQTVQVQSLHYYVWDFA